MDSQENALTQGTEEVKQAEEANKVNPPSGEETAPIAAETAEDAQQAQEEELAKKVYTSKKEIVDRLGEIAKSETTPDKAEIEHLKTTFYKLHFAEREAEQKAFVEAGGDPEKFQILPDDDEQAFKAEMTIIKEKRQKAFQELEQLKQDNLQKKLEIIEKIKAMVTTAEEANANFQNFKALQAEWKEIKPVPAEKANELWRNYQLYVEQFYDLINLNREAREYDFKKNLEKKTALCEAAEKLAEEKDVISASRKLQDLHVQYRETGPVEKDLREQLWSRFKAASTVVNKRHQQFFEDLRSRENDNLEKKTALCEKVEAIVKEENKTNADWERHTQEILDVQQEWKKIGFAAPKVNQKIFDRFRAACDDFFGRKNAHYKERRAQYSENADKKRELIAKAKELMDSTEWRKTADKLIELQKEWKTIGQVPHKLGDELWKEFREACDHFFDARTAAFADVHKEEPEEEAGSHRPPPGTPRRGQGRGRPPKEGAGALRRVLRHRPCAHEAEGEDLSGVPHPARQVLQGASRQLLTPPHGQLPIQPPSGGHPRWRRPRHGAWTPHAPLRATQERYQHLREQPRIPQRQQQEGQ